MKRSCWLRRRRPLTSRVTLDRRRALKRLNARRRAALYARNFGLHAVWIRSLPCCGCGHPAPSDPHHVVKRGMGGCNSHRRYLVPVCRPCHLEAERTNNRSLAEKTGIDPLELAAEYWARSSEVAA